jgi:hypothetical protein
LYAYHNTAHSASGFNPHQLLFGWTPRDLPVLFAAAELKKSDTAGCAEGWLQLRKEQLKQANLNLGYARVGLKIND